MARALGRISLVVFLTFAVSYQSWSIIVPSDSADCLFTAIPAAKLIPSLFDIDDEIAAPMLRCRYSRLPPLRLAHRLYWLRIADIFLQTFASITAPCKR